MEHRYGLIKTTLIDYPGEVAATIFVPGCNFRCPYCHNPELVYGRLDENAMTMSEIVSFLDTRRAVLGGVCISGGEPLLTDRIFDLVRIVRKTDLKVKIDTNGSFPARLSRLIAGSAVDYIAMDIKTIPSRYHLVSPATNFRIPDDSTTREDPFDPVRQSVGIVSRSGLPHHFRTTVVPGIVGPTEMEEICGLIPEGAHLVLQQFRPKITLDPGYAAVGPYSAAQVQEMCRIAVSCGLHCRIGGFGSDPLQTDTRKRNRSEETTTGLRAASGA
jgi:pyruvate formate lyase activating enzyme